MTASTSTPTAPTTSKTRDSSSTPSGPSKTDGLPAHGTTDAAPIRAHLRSLITPAIGFGTIANISGISRHTLRGVLRTRNGQPRPTVHAATAQKILAIADIVATDATGTRRRIKALHHDGYDTARIGREISASPATVANWLRLRMIATCHASAIADLYARWSGVPAETNGSSPAGADAARALARHRRWHPAVCWAGEDIDDPATEPTSARRTWRSEELVAEAEEIRRACGIGWSLIAERLGVKRNTLDKARERVAARARAAERLAAAA